MDPDSALSRILEIVEEFCRIIDKTDGDLVITDDVNSQELARGQRLQLTSGMHAIMAYDWNEIPSNVALNCRLVNINSEFREGANELVDLVRGLDGWLSHGGFLPKAWAHSRYMDAHPGLAPFTEVVAGFEPCKHPANRITAHYDGLNGPAWMARCLDCSLAPIKEYPTRRAAIQGFYIDCRRDATKGDE